MTEIQPEIIPFEYFYHLQKAIINYPESHRNVIVGVKDYPAGAIKCLNMTRPGQRVIIFSMRFIHMQVYQPLLAVYYSNSNLGPIIIDYLTLYWILLIRDLICLKLNIVATLSTTNYNFKQVIEKIAKYNFNENYEAINYTPIPTVNILHLFDIRSLLHYLEKCLLLSDQLLCFLQVDPYEKKYTWRRACFTDILKYFESKYPSTPNLLRESVVIFNSDFYYKYVLRVLGDSETYNTSTFLSRCCPYIEFMNTLTLIKTYDLLNLSNSFRPLKLLLFTAYVTSPEAIKFLRKDETTSSDELLEVALDKYNLFESDYLNSVSLDPNVLNVESWCERLLNTFNNLRRTSLQRVNNHIFIKLQELKQYESTFNTKLSLLEYIKYDGLNQFRNVAFIPDDIDSNGSDNSQKDSLDCIRHHEDLETRSKEMKSADVCEESCNSSLIYEVPKREKQSKRATLSMRMIGNWFRNTKKSTPSTQDKYNSEVKIDSSETTENKDNFLMTPVKKIERKSTNGQYSQFPEPKVTYNRKTDSISVCHSSEASKKEKNNLFQQTRESQDHIQINQDSSLNETSTTASLNEQESQKSKHQTLKSMLQNTKNFSTLSRNKFKKVFKKQKSKIEIIEGCTCYEPSTSTKKCPLFSQAPRRLTFQPTKPDTPKFLFQLVPDRIPRPINNYEEESETTPYDDSVSDYCTSQEFLNKLYGIHAELPMRRSKLWLLQAWLSTLNSFRFIYEFLVNAKMPYLHGHCFNLNHIDHYVNECNYVSKEAVYSTDNEFYMYSNEYQIFTKYGDLRNIVLNHLIRIPISKLEGDHPLK